MKLILNSREKYEITVECRALNDFVSVALTIAHYFNDFQIVTERLHCRTQHDVRIQRILVSEAAEEIFLTKIFVFILTFREFLETISY